VLSGGDLVVTAALQFVGKLPALEPFFDIAISCTGNRCMIAGSSQFQRR